MKEESVNFMIERIISFLSLENTVGVGVLIEFQLEYQLGLLDSFSLSHHWSEHHVQDHVQRTKERTGESSLNILNERKWHWIQSCIRRESRNC